MTADKGVDPTPPSKRGRIARVQEIQEGEAVNGGEDVEAYGDMIVVEEEARRTRGVALNKMYGLSSDGTDQGGRGALERARTTWVDRARPLLLVMESTSRTRWRPATDS